MQGDYINTFITFKARLYNSKQEEYNEKMGIENDISQQPVVNYRFNILNLVAYYRTESELGEDITTIDLTGGHSADLLVSVEDFEEKISEHHNKYFNN